MGTYRYFRIISNDKEFVHGFDLTDEWIITIDKEMYKEDFEKLIKEFGIELNDLSDIDEFCIWLQRKKQLNAYAIDICFVNNPELKDRKPCENEDHSEEWTEHTYGEGKKVRWCNKCKAPIKQLHGEEAVKKMEEIRRSFHV